ncbi:MAG TPA: cytochrome c [Mucilaginibacter sp.]
MSGFKTLLLLVLVNLFLTTGIQAQTKKHKALVKPNRALSLKASVDAGQKVFTEYCASCHQADGMGLPGTTPPLSKTEYVLGDKSRLIKIVLNGLNDEIKVNGDTYSNTMASHDFLNDQEVADVLTYVRNSFGNKATAISVTQVKTLRAASKK